MGVERTDTLFHFLINVTIAMKLYKNIYFWTVDAVVFKPFSVFLFSTIVCGDTHPPILWMAPLCILTSGIAEIQHFFFQTLLLGSCH